jgi:glycosyltransferase involved in cell wall biosynthesis
MRVLHLATTYPLHPGDSNATFVASIADGLAARGHECDVLVPWHPDLQIERSGAAQVVPFRYSPIDSWHPWGYAQALMADRQLRKDAYLAAPLAAFASRRRIRQLHAARPYDLLHAHWFLPNGAIAASAWRRTGLPLVVSCHGSGVFLAEKHRWARRMGAYAKRHATAITACSAELAGRVDAVAPGPPAIRVPYGVDTTRFAPVDAASRAARRADLAARHDLPTDGVWVFAIGRLVFKKGFDVLIRAAAEARDASAPIAVVVAGDGPLDAELKQLAQTCGIAKHVHFIGAVPNAEVPTYYATADVVAVPSVHGPSGNLDGLPNTLLEALATGAAVVASRVAGIPDVVRDGENGLLFPEGDAAGLAAHLAMLSGDRGHAAALGSRARADAVANLDWARTVAQFEEIYTAAVAR